LSFTVKLGFCVVSLLDRAEVLGQFDRDSVSWENKPTRGEEVDLQTPATEVDQMIVQLNEFILPSSLIESFDVYRGEKYKEAIKAVPESTLAWFLEMLNRYRGPEDRKESLLEVFDPFMYTENHPAWDSPPGKVIELPALTSEIVAMAEKGSKLAEVARDEIRQFRHHADSYDDEELMQLGEIAKAGLADQKTVFQTRNEIIRYLALNASAGMEDLWVADGTEWLEAPVRRIEFPDMVARRKEQLLHGQLAPALKEEDFVCYTDDEVRGFACDMRSLFLHDRSRHLAICTGCKKRLEAWTKIISGFDNKIATKTGWPDA